MHSTLTLIFLVLPALTLPVHSTRNLPAGVAPTDASLYLPIPNSQPPRWTCRDGSREIPYAAINDDFCDCKDGSDEPGTSACANGHFYCANEGHIGANIRSSRVNDGLCEPECCDGSDEPSGVCPNTCVEVGKKYRSVIEAERKIRRTGAKIRSTYVAFALKERKRLEESIVSLTEEVAQKKENEARLEDILRRTEALDAAALEHKKKSPLYSHLEDEASIISALPLTQSELETRIETLEGILDGLKRGYNPNYQDMAVLEAVRGWDALNGQGEQKEGGEGDAKEDVDAKEEVVVESKDEPEEGEWTKDEINQIKNKDIISLLIEHEKHIGASGSESYDSSLLYSIELYLPDSFLPVYQTTRDWIVTYLGLFGILSAPRSGDDTPSELSQARSRHSTAANELRSAENSLKSEQEALSKLFSPDGFGKKGEWKKLEEQCLEKDTGEYTYSVCLFGAATQKPNNGGGSNNLGRFSSWNMSPATSPGQLDYYSRQIYDRGAQCWNGPQRSVTLELTCGTENALLSISEPQKCEYHFTGTTPALCWPDEELEEANAEAKAQVPSEEDHASKEEL